MKDHSWFLGHSHCVITVECDTVAGYYEGLMIATVLLSVVYECTSVQIEIIECLFY